MGHPSNRWTLKLFSTKIDGPWDGAPLKSMDLKLFSTKIDGPWDGHPSNRWTPKLFSTKIDGPWDEKMFNPQKSMDLGMGTLQIDGIGIGVRLKSMHFNFFSGQSRCMPGVLQTKIDGHENF